ncbi:glycosyltransferase family 4 protein [Priestia flexa]|uniref:glycosyltransferase family 4 protein n=1 Tax=Priestia flexa TaxID=86664 RepID=UPI0009711A52|nr:glycosyltransferase family 4 protein [Priestia flexa]
MKSYWSEKGLSKRVLVISQNFYPEIGSAGNRIKNIYKLLKEEEYEVNVLTTDPMYPNKKIYSDNQFWDDDLIEEERDVTRIQVKNRKYSRSIMNRLWFYLEMALKMLLFILFDRRKYDVVFVTSPPIFIAVVGLVAKYHYRSKLILDIRDLWPESLKGVGVFNYPFVISLFSKLEKLLYIKSDQIIVNSRGFIDFIVENYNISLEKIHFMPNAAKEDEVSFQEAGQGKFKVIYAGNIGLAQDVNVLMEVAKQLNDYDIELNVMGYGFKKKEFIKFKDQHQLTNVNFIKPTTRKKCLDIISQHHIGLVTLNGKEVFETVLPGKIVDYMTRGIPIVAAVSGYAQEVIESKRVGIVSDSHDVDEVVRHILHLYTNPSLRKEMGSNGLRYVKEHFYWENNIHVLINLIENRKLVTFKLNQVESGDKAEVL